MAIVHAVEIKNGPTIPFIDRADAEAYRDEHWPDAKVIEVDIMRHPLPWLTPSYVEDDPIMTAKMKSVCKAL